jgi:hypothetical protein
VIGVSSDAQNQDLLFLPCQDTDEIQDLVTLDNVTIEEEFLSTCLVVGYSWNGDCEDAEEQNLLARVTLALSIDNVSWREIESHVFEVYENTSRYFRLYNSVFQPFPFDVEPGETLYVTILFSTQPEVGWGNYIEHQTCVVDITVESGIIRHWYFTIDWRIPGIFIFVSGWIGAVFFMVRILKDTKSEN